MKGTALKLLPFIKTTLLFIYFHWHWHEEPETLLGCLVKCLPILSLILFVILHEVNCVQKNQYSKRILAGLVFCCFGDACLVWKEYFELGMVFFAIGHVCYCFAFGFKPISLPFGVVFGVVIVGTYPFIFWNVKSTLAVLGLIYTVLIAVMAWRAFVRLYSSKNLWSLTKILGFAGALLFCTSDLILSINKFKLPLPFSHQLTMGTYYAAQCGIALSVVNSHTSSEKTEKKE